MNLALRILARSRAPASPPPSGNSVTYGGQVITYGGQPITFTA